MKSIYDKACVLTINLLIGALLMLTVIALYYASTLMSANTTLSQLKAAQVIQAYCETDSGRKVCDD